MKKRQKIWIVVLLTLLAAAAVFFALFGSGGKDDAPQTGNLLVNGDFALTTDGEPDGWQTGAWVTSAGASYLEAVTLEDGTTAALVENAALSTALQNDVSGGISFAQQVYGLGRPGDVLLCISPPPATPQTPWRRPWLRTRAACAWRCSPAARAESCVPCAT